LLIPTFLARRFVAGETAETAIAAGLKLRERGIHATFDLLGEDVEDRAAAEKAALGSIELLRKIPDTIQRNVSLKLTSLGLELSPGMCQELALEVVKAADEVGGFVRVDMEGSDHTDATLAVYRALRERSENVGIVLQAMLLRTERDIQEAIERGDRVRLCKGAYKEPRSIALQQMPRIRASYQAYAERLLDAGVHPAIATHDEELIRHVTSYARERGIEPARFELQMLYGLRPRRWD
jgi:proline dehydrogenase